MPKVARKRNLLNSFLSVDIFAQEYNMNFSEAANHSHQTVLGSFCSIALLAMMAFVVHVVILPP